MKDIVFKAPIDGFQFLRKDALNYYKILSGSTRVVPANTEMFVTDELEVIGSLVIEGRVTVWDSEAFLGIKSTTVTTSTTLNASHEYVFCDASSGAITITLPALASNLGKVFSIKAIDTTNPVVVDGSAGETIDGSLTKTILLNASMKIIATTSGWFIV